MSLITGKVLSVSLGVPYPKKDSTETYPAWVLSYITDRNEKRDIVKHMNSLKYGPGPAIHAVLRELKQGDEFSAQVEKKGQFNEIVGLVKGTPSVEMAAQAESQKTDSPIRSASKSSGSTYETPEERALRREADKIKQRLIVRQSSFDQAREVMKGKGNLDDIFETASAIETWVYRGIE